MSQPPVNRSFEFYAKPLKRLLKVRAVSQELVESRAKNSANVGLAFFRWPHTFMLSHETEKQAGAASSHDININ